LKTATKEHDLEALLLSEYLVTEEQMARARRIGARLQNPKPVGEVLVELGQLPRSEYDRVVRLYRSQLSTFEILREDGALNESALATYEEVKSRDPERTDRDILVGDGLVTEEQYLLAFASKHGIPFIEPEAGLVDASLLSKVSVPYLIRNRVLPFRVADGHLTVIMADPLDNNLVSELEKSYAMPVKTWCATSSSIVQTLETLESLQSGQEQDVTTTLQYYDIEEAAQEDESGEGAIRMVDYLLFQAIRHGASDLHVEPLETRIRVRIRVDGVIRTLTDLPSDLAGRITSRIKVLSAMDIAERRLHQDGRFFVKIEGREVDIRVSSYASTFGETLVLRLLDRRRGLMPLDKLGLEPRILTMVREVALRDSSGLVLVTGPTGSGKTTSMYSFVDYINDDNIKIITAENPVEYILEGTTQCSVREKTGPTFADSLRAIVRQDPDVIVVGEIRDGTTANLAVEAALTGHKVLSTFHTEDAVSAVVRLLDMGIEPFLVSSTLTCIIAQRLVRQICEQCRRPGRHSRKDLRYMGLDVSDLARLPAFEGAGCPECEQTGYRGRIGVYEVLLLNDDFRDAILQRASSKDLRVLARQLRGFLTLHEAGLLKVASGAATLADVANRVPRDPGARPLATLTEAAAMRGDQ
jgi:type IV pilus assembly protein PilB